MGDDQMPRSGSAPRPLVVSLTMATATAVAVVVGSWLAGAAAGDALAGAAGDVPRSAAAEVSPSLGSDPSVTSVEESAPLSQSEPVAMGVALPEDVPRDAGLETAEAQCMAIEDEVGERWDDGRMSDADYDARWESLSEAEYEALVFDGLGAVGSVGGEERPTFLTFDENFAADTFTNRQLIDGYDNCYELELFNFE